MLYLKLLLTVLLILVISRILNGVLKNIAEKLQRDILRDRIYSQGVFSRKDLASIRSHICIRSRLLYKFAANRRFPLPFFPYSYICEDRSALDMSEFVQWCRHYLRLQGYEPEDTKAAGDDQFRRLVCQRDGEMIYAECWLQQQNSSVQGGKEDDWPRLGRPQLQKLVGTMTADGIYTGIVLTTGDFSGEAIDYAASLPPPIKLLLFDGCTLSRTHRQLVKAGPAPVR